MQNLNVLSRDEAASSPTATATAAGAVAASEGESTLPAINVYDDDLAAQKCFKTLTLMINYIVDFR